MDILYTFRNVKSTYIPPPDKYDAPSNPNHLTFSCLIDDWRMTTVEQPSPDFVLRGSDGAVTSLAFFRLDAKHNLLLSGSETGSIYVWDMHTCRTVHRLSAHDGSVLSITVLDIGDQVLSYGRDGLLHRWKVKERDSWNKLGMIFSCW